MWEMRKPERKGPFGRPGRRCADIRMGLQEMAWGDIDLVHGSVAESCEHAMNLLLGSD